MCASFSADAIVFSERKGLVRCIESASGASRWTFQPEQDRNVEHIDYLESEKVFVAFDCRYEDHKPPARLLHLDAASGSVVKEVVLGDWGGAEFCLNATALFDHSGMLVSTCTGKLLRMLAFPSR